MQSPDNERTLEFPESPSIPLPPTPSSSAPGTPRSCTPQPSGQLSKKATRGVKNKCDEVLDVIGKRLAQPSKNIADKFSDIGKAWSSKLRDLDPQQAVHAEKIINDVFYEAQLGNLHRNCFLQLQPKHTGNIQPLFYTEPPFYTQQSLQTQASYNTQPPFNTRQSLHIQPSYNTQLPITSSNVQPTEKPLPPEKSQTAAGLFHSFTNFLDGTTK